MTGNGSRNQLRQPRLAELVAGALRDEILSGQLGDGDTLPRQEDLLASFGVSPPAVREALRILETEGLIRVRRGNVGGAVVRTPSAEGVAYMVGLVLQLRHTSLADVGDALRDMEPVCTALCARRKDRRRTVVPVLRALVDEQRRALPDTIAFNQASRRFHEALVAHCGSDTLTVVVGSARVRLDEPRAPRLRARPGAGDRCLPDRLGGPRKAGRRHRRRRRSEGGSRHPPAPRGDADVHDASRGPGDGAGRGRSEPADA